MTSRDIRQSFLDFFAEKGHSIVPSASLMPTSPNLLFTNAGMNPFIPYFLGTEAAPYDPPRAADTQKCIRAGGKHNDLEDVGYDTYHHTLFEMLGNWSFGDYFKAEAIAWAWELLTERWGLPANRLYATVYAPAEGDPAEFDQEAYDLWAAIFKKAGLDPAVHIVNGNKKDNFWMMGETGPCGPCSEVHIDLTPAGDTKGSLVNAGDARCIEIWNLVFIQFNANEDGTFRPLPACHVDTGMGFERACAVIQGTKSFTDFSKLASNYDTDVFTPIFAKLTELSGKTYTATVPEGGKRHSLSEQELVDVAFRVIGDHLRAVSFAIADGIEPGNGGRNYVIRNILRRAVRFGRVLGFDAENPFLHRLVPVLATEFGGVFPEIAARQEKIAAVLKAEEEQFNRTLDRGLKLFDEAAAKLPADGLFPAATVVKLWETYGFPTDLTQLLLDERRLATDPDEVARLVEAHKSTGAEGRTTAVVEAVTIETDVKTEFVGYERDEAEATVAEWIENGAGCFAIVDRSPFYIEKGGQLGDTGTLVAEGESIPVLAALGVGEATVLQLAKLPDKATTTVTLKVGTPRRRGIEAHHTATHLFHWALHEVVSPDATQQGSLVAPDRLRFDFNSTAVPSGQLAKIESEVNERIRANDTVTVSEVPHAEVKGNPKVMQFFGDKYGDTVRVVQIGGAAGKLAGYSMELCGGTHTRATGEIGLFRIVGESAIAAGVRRIEAVAGLTAYDVMRLDRELIKTVAGKVNSPIHELEKKIESLLAQQKALEKEVQIALQRNASNAASELLGSAQTVNGIPLITHNLGSANGDFLQAIADALKGRFQGVVVLGGGSENAVALVATVSPEFTAKVQAGKLIQAIAPIVGGKGGGKPDNARGGGKEVGKLDEALAKVKNLIG